MWCDLNLPLSRTTVFLTIWVNSARDRKWKVRPAAAVWGQTAIHRHQIQSGVSPVQDSFISDRTTSSVGVCSCGNTLFIYVCVSACVLCAFTHACKALFLCLRNCVCRQYTRRRSCMCSSASLWTEWPALHVTDLLYEILYEWENRLLISQLL